MNDLMKGVRTMDSREIAELTGKEHRKVTRDIEEQLGKLPGGVTRFGHTYRNEQNGQEYPCFKLPYRETMILVSGYTVELRAKIIDRWMELERGTAYKIPSTLSEALYLAADLEEKRALLEAKVEKDAPKIEEHDIFINSEDDECITVAMKSFPHLDAKNDIFKFLRATGYIVGVNRVIPSSLALKEDYMIKKSVLGNDGVTFHPTARIQNRQMPKWRNEMIPRIERWKARRDSVK